jgi:hypothetical protein
MTTPDMPRAKLPFVSRRPNDGAARETTMSHSIRRATGLTTAAVILMAATLPTAAEAQRHRAEPQLQVSYVTDGNLTCEQLTGEITRMEEIAGISAENAQNAQTQGALVDGAVSVGVTAAAYSGVLGAVPGLGLFANMAGQAARRNGEARARAEAERIRIAEQRHSLLTGIYQGRRCGVPPSPAMVEAAMPASPGDPSPAEAAPTPATLQLANVQSTAPAATEGEDQ